jgi:hypothetical protein
VLDFSIRRNSSSERERDWAVIGRRTASIYSRKFRSLRSVGKVGKGAVVTSLKSVSTEACWSASSSMSSRSARNESAREDMVRDITMGVFRAVELGSTNRNHINVIESKRLLYLGRSSSPKGPSASCSCPCLWISENL